MTSPAQTPAAPTAPIPEAPVRAGEERSARIAVTVFPLLILAAAAFGFFVPGAAKQITPHVTTLLMLIMFGMGLTLTVPDFALVVRRPLPVLLGVVAQYGIMPLLGYGVAQLLGLSPELAAGVILVGCAPGGTASNVISYLSKADTALSVTITSISTLLAPLLTPLLTLWLAGTYMPVDGAKMAGDIVKIVLLPVLGGLVLRLLLGPWVKRILGLLPWISVLAISGVVAGVVGPSADKLVKAGGIVLLAVVLHNCLGYALGYGFSRLFRQSERTARTVAIEVGMQNSGLAAGLAGAYFSPVAALPGAVFSVWHNISGAVLAMVLRRTAERHQSY
ncbi:bile acid:sodium symporter family protein [Luteococcus peritonei]|uniref:Bile acid:sodium symporter family protein n=1 Tax=Luteococcus peritonei TaxID=88874 RepID=A0ABW4RT55_9ACTN